MLKIATYLGKYTDGVNPVDLILSDYPDAAVLSLQKVLEKGGLFNLVEKKLDLILIDEYSPVTSALAMFLSASAFPVLFYGSLENVDPDEDPLFLTNLVGVVDTPASLMTILRDINGFVIKGEDLLKLADSHNEKSEQLNEAGQALSEQGEALSNQVFEYYVDLRKRSGLSTT